VRERVGAGVASVAETAATLARISAFAGLSFEDRLGLAGAATVHSLPPGAPITIDGIDSAKAVVSGWAVMRSGETAGPGALIGPAETAGYDDVVEVGRARTRYGCWSCWP
jgi:hypothetical protein